jgi:hypothetical protein
MDGYLEFIIFYIIIKIIKNSQLSNLSFIYLFHHNPNNFRHKLCNFKLLSYLFIIL